MADQGGGRRDVDLLSVKIGREWLDWLDSLGPEGEKPNRSFHTRQALRLYKESGYENVIAALSELRQRQDEMKIDPQVRRFGDWMLALPDEVRGLLVLLGDHMKQVVGDDGLSSVASKTLRGMDSGNA